MLKSCFQYFFYAEISVAASFQSIQDSKRSVMVVVAVSKFKTETKEDEQRVMARKSVNIHKSRMRVMTKSQKEQRSLRVKAASG